MVCELEGCLCWVTSRQLSSSFCERRDGLALVVALVGSLPRYRHCEYISSLDPCSRHLGLDIHLYDRLSVQPQTDFYLDQVTLSQLT